MKYNQGDIILLPFPYTDLSKIKQRPAIIISSNSINHNNYIVAKLTSVIRSDKFSFPITPLGIDRELKFESEVRTNEIFTVSSEIIIKKFATLNQTSLKQLIDQVRNNLRVD